MPLRRTSQVLAALTLLTILTWVGWSFRRSNSFHPLSPPVDHNADSHSPAAVEPVTDADATVFDTLCHYGICDVSPDASITYGRVDIEVVENPSFEVPLLHDVSISLPVLEPLDSKDTLRLSNAPSRKARIEIAPRPSPANSSNAVFGVATNIDRLEDSLDQFSHWAAGNGARIIALVPNTSLSEDVTRTLEKSRRLQVDLTVITSGLGFNDRYFHLTSVLYNHSTSSTAWAAFIDDDTFFPSMNSLQNLLSKYPSPITNPYYVGTLSEDFHQLFKWGFMAYGGGGVFISIGLLRELYPYLSECSQLSHTGDARLAQCIFLHTLTKLSPEVLLFQLDFWGDITGFYEALRPQPISVHHWKSWHKFDMVNISKVSSICSDACVFQKYRFDDDYQLTNGFSIVKYSEGNERTASDVRMERTWWDSQGGSLDMFLHSVSPLKPKDENKIQYLLEGSFLEDGTVRQFYTRRTAVAEAAGEEGEEKKEKLYVQIIEVVWRIGNAIITA